MKDALRLKRFGLGHAWAAGLGLMVAALISACAVGPDQATGATTAPPTLSYFVATSAEGSRPGKTVSSTFRTLSGATVDVWRETEPRRTIAFDEIRALRISEARPSPSLSLSMAPPTDYVVAEVKVNGPQAKSFWSLLEEQGDAFFWVSAREGEAIDFLPIEHALRPSQEGSSTGVWVSAGTFQNRQEADDFFEELGDIPRTFTALSDSEQAVAVAEDERLIDYAIWESICDPLALAELGGRLAQLLPALPDYEERARAADCRVRPELGGTMAPDPSPTKSGAMD